MLIKSEERENGGSLATLLWDVTGDGKEYPIAYKTVDIKGILIKEREREAAA